MTTANTASAGIVCLQQANAELGETPLWHPIEQVLYWIDVSRPAIYRYDPAKGQTGNWPMPSAVGAFGLCADGDFIVATEKEGIGLFDPRTCRLRPVANPREGQAGRFNDGRVDAAGRFWVGWLTHSRKRPGCLYRIGNDGACVEGMTDIVAPNGLGWSPDGGTMYVTDSHIGTIWACEFDPADGVIGKRRPFFRHAREDGIVDGLAVDSEGCVWTALYNGWGIIRLDPTGAIVEQVAMPVALPTSCAFGGADLRTLYITSAIRQQDATTLLNQPWAGGLMSKPVRVAGMAEPLARIAIR